MHVCVCVCVCVVRVRERADPVGQEDERAEEHGWVEGEVASQSQSQSREHLQTCNRS